MFLHILTHHKNLKFTQQLQPRMNNKSMKERKKRIFVYIQLICEK